MTDTQENPYPLLQALVEFTITETGETFKAFVVDAENYPDETGFTYIYYTENGTVDSVEEIEIEEGEVTAKVLKSFSSAELYRVLFNYYQLNKIITEQGGF